MLLTFSRRTTGKGKTEGEPGKTARRCELWPRLSRAARPRCPRRLRASQGRRGGTSPRPADVTEGGICPHDPCHTSFRHPGWTPRKRKPNSPLVSGSTTPTRCSGPQCHLPSPLSGARLPKDDRPNHPDDRLLKGGGGCLGATVPNGSEHNSRHQCPHAHGWPGPPGPRTSNTWGPAGNTPQRAG